MVNIGTTSLKNPPKVAVSITDQEANQDILAHRMDVLELRVDRFQNRDIEQIKANIQERKKTNLPLILTVRSEVSEGGDGSVTNEEKLQIFKAVMAGVDAVDIELQSEILSSVMDMAKKENKTIIISSHNFQETPSDDELKKILEDSLAQGADIVKVAAMAQSKEDVARLMEFTRENRASNIITMSLGEIGSTSRVTFPACGSLLTYSFIGEPLAPGQLPVDVLQEHLRAYNPQDNSNS